MSLKHIWKDAPREFRVVFLIMVIGFTMILAIGFTGEYQDWDGERAAQSEYNRTPNGYTGDQGYEFKCIKECVACHTKMGFPLNKNMNVLKPKMLPYNFQVL